MINVELEKRELPIRYAKKRHPGNTPIEHAEMNLEEGVNCQVFIGLVLMKLGKDITEVPNSPRSKELWEDEIHTAFLGPDDAVQTGDVVFLTDPQEKRDPMWYHVGVLVVDINGMTLITHASEENGFAVLEPLSKAMTTPKYARNAGVKRVLKENPNGPNHAYLEEMGLGGIIA